MSARKRARIIAAMARHAAVTRRVLMVLTFYRIVFAGRAPGWFVPVVLSALPRVATGDRTA